MDEERKRKNKRRRCAKKEKRTIMVAVINVKRVNRKWRWWRRRCCVKFAVGRVKFAVEHVKFAVGHVIEHVEEHAVQHKSNRATAIVESLTGRPVDARENGKT